MIVAVGGLVHEANAFAPPSAPDDVIVIPPEKMLRAFAGTSTEISGFLDAIEGEIDRHDLVPLGFAYGESGGMLDDDVALALCADLVDRAEATRPDVVLLALHGSMATPGIDDVEGLLLGRLRARLGESCVIVATLDWHCSITSDMVAAADLLVGYRTYPHVDQRDRAARAAHLALRIVDGSITPTAAWIRPPMIIAGPATSHQRSPMRELLATAAEIADRYPAVIDWSLCPGFARSDVPLAGSQIYVAADGDRGQSDDCARELARALWERRTAFLPDLHSVDSAVEFARRAAEAETSAPLVLSDQGDNPGGGATADSTVLLDALVDADVDRAVVCSLWDPTTVSDASRTGVGGDFDWHGRRARVVQLADGRYTMHSPTHDGVKRSVGAVATLAVDGIQVIVTSTRVQNEDLEFLAMAGIDPLSAAVLVVKSNAHFRAAFAPIASRIVDVDTPGLSTPHLDRLPFERIGRPVFPLDEFEWNP